MAAVASITTPAPAAPKSSANYSPPASVPAHTSAQPPASVRTAATTSRFALEFGPFATAADAEQVERSLTQAGLPTVRFRQQTGSALYAVLLERLAGATEAQALVATLREQGYGEAAITRQEPPVVRVGEPAPLRRAVELAERLRAGGYQVRVAAQPGEAIVFTIRHGSFTSKPEAETRAQELGRLGVPAQIIQVR